MKAGIDTADVEVEPLGAKVNVNEVEGGVSISGRYTRALSLVLCLCRELQLEPTASAKNVLRGVVNAKVL